MLRIVVPAAAVVLAASPVLAQDFLGALARSAARSAAGAVASRVTGEAAAAVTRPQSVDPLASPTAAPVATVTAPVASQPASAAVVPASPPITPDAAYFPAVVNYRPGMKPYELRVSRTEAQERDERVVLIDFTTYDCNDCEGGRWNAHNHPPEAFSNWAQITAGLAVGQTTSWRARGVDTLGITVVSEMPVGDIPCKWAKLVATKGGHSVDRPMVFCQGQIEDGGADRLMGWRAVYGDGHRFVEQRIPWK